MRHSTFAWQNDIYPGFCRPWCAHSTSQSDGEAEVCGGNFQIQCNIPPLPDQMTYTIIYPGFCQRWSHSTSQKWWLCRGLRIEQSWTMQHFNSWSRHMVRWCGTWQRPCVATRLCLSRWDFAADFLWFYWGRSDALERTSVWSCLGYSEAHRARIESSTPKSLVGGLEHVFIFPYIGNFIIPTDFHIFQRGRYTTNQVFEWSCLTDSCWPRHGKPWGKPCRCHWNSQAWTSHLASKRAEFHWINWGLIRVVVST